jgi:hypothetical protein
LALGLRCRSRLACWRNREIAVPEHVQSKLDQPSGECRCPARGPKLPIRLDDELKARRDEAVRVLNEAPQLRCRASPGAFYLFVNCAGAIGQKTPTGTVIASDTDLAKFLVDDAGVGTVAGRSVRRVALSSRRLPVPLPVLRRACSKIVQSCGYLR